MKISIIVPAYNIESYIEKCLNSIINQTYKELEIIVVNDGSTDHTPDIINRIAMIDKRIIVIHKPNGGLSSARNAGLDRTTGDYIGFVDGDDFIAEDMYELLLKNMMNTDSEISICKVQRIYKNHFIKESDSNKQVVLNNVEGLRSLLEGTIIHHYAVDKLYNKRLFETIRYPEGKIFEDVFTTYKLFAQSKRTVYCDASKYFYVQRANSILRKSFNEKKLEYLEAVNEMAIFINENYKELSDYPQYCYAIANCALLLELLKYNFKYPQNDFNKIGTMLSRNIRNSLGVIIKNQDTIKHYKLLSIGSLFGYGICKRINNIIMNYLYKEKELL